MSSFKIGDIVALKSGSPKMTINKVVGEMLVGSIFKCVWFVGTKIHTTEITEQSLNLVADTEQS